MPLGSTTLTPFRYTSAQAAVHWLVATLVIFLLATGSLVLADLPNTAPKLRQLGVHMGLGALAVLLVMLRLVLRRRSPPAPAEAGGGLARIGHAGLNGVVLLMAISGAVLAVDSGALAAVFGAGSVPPDFMVFTPRKVHGLLSRVAMALIAAHVLAALYHQFILRDGRLARMRLGGR